MCIYIILITKYLPTQLFPEINFHEAIRKNQSAEDPVNEITKDETTADVRSDLISSRNKELTTASRDED